MMRPRAMQQPGLDVVRRARVRAVDGALVVTGRDGGERRYEAGGPGIAAARYFPPSHGEKHPGPQLLRRLGVVVFEDADRLPVLRLPLTQWLPEAEHLGAHAGADPLARSGAPELARALGVPLTTSETPLHDMPGAYQGGGAAPPVHRLLPRGVEWVRGIAALVWMCAFVTGTAGEDHRDLAYATAAAALFVLVAAPLCVRHVLLRRAGEEVPPGAGVLVRPAPEASASVTRRFRRVPFVKVLPADVVLCDALGEERWLARDGEAGVKALVVTEDAAGAPTAVEFHDGGGRVRAVLPWRWWFAGPDGDARWRALTVAMEVPVRRRGEPARRKQRRPPGEGEGPLAGDLRRMAPQSPAAARRGTRAGAGVADKGELTVVPLFAVLLLGGLARGPAEPLHFLAGLLALLTLLSLGVPAAAHQLVSRLCLDRPAAPPTEETS